MTKNFISFIFLISQLNGLDLHGIDTLSQWETLQTGAINVAWRDYRGFPISRAETTLNHSIETVSNAIQDLDKRNRDLIQKKEAIERSKLFDMSLFHNKLIEIYKNELINKN